MSAPSVRGRGFAWKVLLLQYLVFLAVLIGGGVGVRPAEPLSLPPSATLEFALRGDGSPEASDLRTQLRLGPAHRIEPLFPGAGPPTGHSSVDASGEIVDSVMGARLVWSAERMMYLAFDLESGDSVRWMGDGPPPRRRRGGGRGGRGGGTAGGGSTRAAGQPPGPDTLPVQGDPFLAPPFVVRGVVDSESNRILIAGSRSFVLDQERAAILPRFDPTRGDSEGGARIVNPVTPLPNFQAALSDGALWIFEGDQPNPIEDELVPRAVVPLTGSVDDLVRVDLQQMSDGYLIALVYGQAGGAGSGSAASIRGPAGGRLELVQLRGRTATPSFEIDPLTVETRQVEALLSAAPAWVRYRGFLTSPLMDAVHRLGAAVVSRARGDRARFGAAMAGGIPFGGTSGSTAGSTAGNTAGNTLAFGIVLMILSGLVVRRSLSRVEGRTRTIWTAMGVAGGPAAAAAIILIARRAPEPDQPNPLA